MFSQLQQFAIEFSVKGLETVKQAFLSVNAAGSATAKGMSSIAGAIVGAFKPTETMARGLNADMAGFADKTRKAFQFLSEGAGHVAIGLSLVVAPLQGMALAGISASGAGQIMSLQFAELNRQIGSIFVPTVNLFMERMSALIRWFQGLSGEQQKALRQWGLTLAGMALVGGYLPRLTASYQALSAAVSVAGKALALIPLSNPIALATIGMAALLASTYSWEDVLDGIKTAARDLHATFKDLGSAMRDIGESTRTVSDSLGLTKTSGESLLAKAWKLSNGSIPGSLLQASVNPDKFKSPWAGLLGSALFPGFSLLSDAARGLGWSPKGEGPPESRKELPPALGAMEGVDQTWRRIAMRSRTVGGMAEKSEAEKQTGLLEDIKVGIMGVRAKMDESRPLLGS